jgi:hypothetical protein
VLHCLDFGDVMPIFAHRLPSMGASILWAAWLFGLRHPACPKGRQVLVGLRDLANPNQNAGEYAHCLLAEAGVWEPSPGWLLAEAGVFEFDLQQFQRCTPGKLPLKWKSLIASESLRSLR